MADDMQELRTRFPVFGNRTYINSCSYGALSLRVRAAFDEYLDMRAREGSCWEQWVHKLAELRGLLGRLLCAPPADIAITTSVTEAVNTLAGTLDFSSGRDTVVVTDFDFPTTSQIWLARERGGARVLRARADNSGTHIPLAAFDQLIDERTALVSIPWVCYRNGVCLDPVPIIEMAHARGARVLVDAYQAIGTFPVDVTTLGADFLTGGCLKYLLGTAGVGYLYVRDSEQLDLMPGGSGWFAQRDVGAMDSWRNDPAPDARRFEAGTPNVAGLYAACAGLEELFDTGMERVATQNRRLTDALVAGTRERGWALTTPGDPSLHGALIAIAATDAPALVRALAGDAIIVSDRDGNLRVSPHYYNNDADIERLFESLERHSALLVRGASE